MLIEHLPPESATKTAMRNAAPEADLEQVTADHRPDRAPWSGTEMLLAALTDEVRLLRMVTVAANGGKPGDFTPTPRPGIPPTSAPKQRKRLTDEQRAALDPRLRNQPKEA
ncbi:hypothetical protein ABZ352_23680 [Streptomyces griseofuscus]|uniref:hypothetical protein n=1 Tax=Streptomyces griseofuscus TaxID=146922 RepID=UPI003408165D